MRGWETAIFEIVSVSGFDHAGPQAETLVVFQLHIQQSSTEYFLSVGYSHASQKV